MNILAQLKGVRCFVFDIDGVLTDGKVLLLENGLQARSMNIKDGLALQMALQQNYQVVIISGAYSAPVLDRLKYLGISEVYLAIKNKLQFLETFFSEKNIDWATTLYMGDDLPDLAVLQKAGVAACPADAVQEVKNVCSYQAIQKGGEGCVREVIEKVLKLNNHWHVGTNLTSK